MFSYCTRIVAHSSRSFKFLCCIPSDLAKRDTILQVYYVCTFLQVYTHLNKFMRLSLSHSNRLSYLPSTFFLVLSTDNLRGPSDENRNN